MTNKFRVSFGTRKPKHGFYCAIFDHAHNLHLETMHFDTLEDAVRWSCKLMLSQIDPDFQEHRELKSCPECREVFGHKEGCSKISYVSAPASAS